MFFFVSACGNNITRDKDAANKNMTWPTLALAVNEISSVRCTATIGLFQMIYDKNWNFIILNLFFIHSEPKMGIG